MQRISEKWIIRITWAFLILVLLILSLIGVESSHSTINNYNVQPPYQGPWAYEDAFTDHSVVFVNLLGFTSFSNTSDGSSPWILLIGARFTNSIRMHQRVDYDIYVSANYSSPNGQLFRPLPGSYMTVDSQINKVEVPSNLHFSVDTNTSQDANYTKLAHISTRQSSFDKNGIDNRFEITLNIDNAIAKQWYYGQCIDSFCQVIQSLRVKIILSYYESLPLASWGKAERFEFILGNGNPTSDVSALSIYPSSY